MKQCELSRGSERTILWIDNRGAIEGASVELVGSGMWRVETVYPTDVSSTDIREKQRMDRNALPSIIGAA